MKYIFSLAVQSIFQKSYIVTESKQFQNEIP